MKKHRQTILIFLIATATFSCNNQTNESKSTATADTTTNHTVDKVVSPDTSNSGKKHDFVLAPSRNASTNPSFTKQQTVSTTQLSDIYKQLDKTPQIFSITTNKDTTLICNEGTNIKIKAKSFISEKTGKEISGNVQISIKEYYKLSDILLAKLSTTSNGNLLETAGMIYITASANNENCILKQEQKIEISFPAKKKKDDMQLYTGNWKSDYQINWEDVTNSKDLNKIYSASEVHEMSTYPGGDNKLFEYFRKNIKYPQKAKELGIQGTAYIGLTVDRDGNISNTKIIKGFDSECDAEALKVVKKIPKFIPAKVNGENVSVNFIIPIKFRSADGDSTKNVAYTKNFEKTYNDTTVQNAGVNNISSYVFSSTQLGWINCDRLWKNNSAPKVNYFVDIDNSKNSDLKVVFHRFKSIMDGFPENNLYAFQNIPSGEKITIVAIKYINDKPFLAIKETQTSSQTEKDLAFLPVTMETLKTEIKKLDRLN